LDLNFVPFHFRTVLETLFFRRILVSVTVERVIMDMSQVLEYIRDIPQVKRIPPSSSSPSPSPSPSPKCGKKLYHLLGEF
jgi:hypothetical protein